MVQPLGTPIDQRTALLGLLLPHLDNDQRDDVARLRAALAALDTLVAARVTQAQMQAALAALIDNAPGVLDTFREFADSLENDPHFAATMTTRLAALQAAIAAITFASLQGKPTTLVGYGITDAAPRMVLDPVPKTAAFAAALDTIYLLDSSGGAFTITMPATGTTGRALEVVDVGGALDTQTVTLARNGLKFRGAAEDYVLNRSGVRRRCLYTNAAYGWSV